MQKYTGKLLIYSLLDWLREHSLTHTRWHARATRRPTNHVYLFQLNLCFAAAALAPNSSWTNTHFYAVHAHRIAHIRSRYQILPNRSTHDRIPNDWIKFMKIINSSDVLVVSVWRNWVSSGGGVGDDDTADSCRTTDGTKIIIVNINMWLI